MDAAVLGKQAKGVMVIDELQDLSRREINWLRLLAKDDQICFCIGDHQRLRGSEYAIPFVKSLYLKGEANQTRQTGNSGEINSVVLSASYRCAPRIIEWVNYVLQLKYHAGGGSKTRDRNELNYVKSVMEDDSAGSGRVIWYEGAQEVLEPLAVRHANDADFAVVTDEKHLAEAQKMFGAHCVFLAEDIKGLEYKTVLSYRQFETERAANANEVIDEEFVLQGKTDQIEARQNQKGSLAHNPFFNEIFVAGTRAEEELCIYHSARHDKVSRKLLKKLKEAMNPSWSKKRREG